VKERSARITKRANLPTARRGQAILFTLLVLLNLGTVESLVLCLCAEGHIRIELPGDRCHTPSPDDSTDEDGGLGAVGPEAVRVPELDGCGSSCLDIPLSHSFSSCRVECVQLHCPEASATYVCAGTTAAATGRLRPNSSSSHGSLPHCLGVAILLL
jgi:hypothetical protein